VNTVNRSDKVCVGLAIALVIALILTWLPADSSAGSRSHAFGNGATNLNAGNNQIPQEPTKVRNFSGDQFKIGNNQIPQEPMRVHNYQGLP
jgi:hypothetical protein